MVGLGVSLTHPCLGGGALPLRAFVELLSAVGGAVNAASIGIVVESGPVVGEVVPSRSSLSVNRGSYDSCSVRVVSIVRGKGMFFP